MSKKETLGVGALYQTPFSRAYWRQAAAEFKDLRILLFAALMIALRVALKPVSIPVAANLNINTAFIVNAFGAMVFGPVVAVPAAIISDTLGCILFPSGVYYPPFVLTEIASSVIFALFLYRTEITVSRLFLSKFCINFFVNIVLQTPIMRGYYAFTGSSALYPLFDGVRIAKNLVMLPIEAVVLVLLFRALMPPMEKLGYVKSTMDRLRLTKRHIVLLTALSLLGATAVGGYAVYDYNTKSFSASYTAKERLERNSEMNAWVVSDDPGLAEEDTVTVILSARSQVGNPEMTYELAVYRIDWETFQKNQADKEAKGETYTVDTLRGYSKSKAAKDAALIRVGTATAVTDKKTGEHLRLTWTEKEQ